MGEEWGPLAAKCSPRLIGKGRSRHTHMGKCYKYMVVFEERGERVRERREGEREERGERVNG